MQVTARLVVKELGHCLCSHCILHCRPDLSVQAQPVAMERVVGLVNRLQQICTQLGDTAGNSILVDKLSSIVVVGGQVRVGGDPAVLIW